MFIERVIFEHSRVEFIPYIDQSTLIPGEHVVFENGLMSGE